MNYSKLSPLNKEILNIIKRNDGEIEPEGFILLFEEINKNRKSLKYEELMTKIENLSNKGFLFIKETSVGKIIKLNEAYDEK